MASSNRYQPKKLLYVSRLPDLGSLPGLPATAHLFDSEYLKRDDQFLALRLTQEERRNRLVAQHRDKDRTRAQGGNDSMLDADATLDLDDEGVEDEVAAATGDQDFFPGNDVIVIHPGSQNLRIGFASDALPKTVPMVIARKWKCNEWEEGTRDEIPKRIKAKDGSEVPPRQMFGDEASLLSVSR